MSKNFGGLFGIYRAVVLRSRGDILDDLITRYGPVIQVAIVGHHKKAIQAIKERFPNDFHEMQNDPEFVEQLAAESDYAFPYATICTVYFKDQQNSIDGEIGNMLSSLFGMQTGEVALPIIWPKVGDIVWVMFEGGDISSPVYVGTLADEFNGLIEYIGSSSNDYTSSGNAEMYEDEGYIAFREESGNDPGCIGAGSGNDPGGKSYGLGQIASGTGSLAEFMEFMKRKYPDFYNRYFLGLPLASTSFDAAWKKAASEESDLFRTIQVDKLKNECVIPWQADALKKTGIDFSRSMALNELSWARSDQNGVNSASSTSLLDGITSKMSDKEVIEIVYNRLITNYTEWLPGYEFAANVRNRWIREKAELISLIGKNYKGSTTSTGSGKFIWPAPGTTLITSGVGPRWGRNHNGIDISGANCLGNPIVAAASGTVTVACHSGWGGGYGLHVYIDHGNGYITRYAHASEVLVNVGQKVSKGETIARIGSTGDSTGPHLHFEIRLNGEVKDPEEYVHQ